MITVLGIESTCDDTAAALVSLSEEGALVHSSIVSSQYELHQNYGGVVPEIAARAHAERLDLVTQKALERSGKALSDIDAIAVSAGPGLIGGVLSGVSFAKALALAMGKPFIGVNHLAGHALTPRLTDNVAYPYLMLLVSGGHCQFIVVSGPNQFRRLGGTIDDAPGEAFDKTAKLLGLGYPGGPHVEEAAKQGDPARFAFPRPLLDREGCDMSFSGLKTALRRACDDLVKAQGGLKPQDINDLCASFQAALSDVLYEKTARAIRAAGSLGARPCLAVAGGVAANQSVRGKLEALCLKEGFRFLAPPLAYCTDNAAMIAYAGGELLIEGEVSGFDLAARPRWPLDQEANPLLGAGRKGPKA